MADRINTLLNNIRGFLIPGDKSDAVKLQLANHVARHRIVVPVTIVPDADSDYLIWQPECAVQITKLQFVPCKATTESDTDKLDLDVKKGDLAAGSLTAVTAASITTAATGQVGDLAARTAKTWTLSATIANRQLAADQGLYLTVDESGTGPAQCLSVVIEFDFMD